MRRRQRLIPLIAAQLLCIDDHAGAPSRRPRCLRRSAAEWRRVVWRGEVWSGVVVCVFQSSEFNYPLPSLPPYPHPHTPITHLLTVCCTSWHVIHALRALFQRSETQVRSGKRKYRCGRSYGHVAILPAQKGLLRPAQILKGLV